MNTVLNTINIYSKGKTKKWFIFSYAMAYAKIYFLKVSWQRHAGKCVTISSLERKAQCVAFADVWGVNNPITADFKQPIGSHLNAKLERDAYHLCMPAI